MKSLWRAYENPMNILWKAYEKSTGEYFICFSHSGQIRYMNDNLCWCISGVVASADAFDVDSALDFDLDHITGSHTPSGSDLVDQSLPDSLLSPGDGLGSMDTGIISD